MTTQPLRRVAVKLWGSKLPKQKGLSSLTRIPLDSANVDIISGLTISVLKLYFFQVPVKPEGVIMWPAKLEGGIMWSARPEGGI